MNIQLIDKMGGDLSVVNAARVSFAKKKDVIDQSDEKLIKYLAAHDHWSPFGHTTVQFLIKAPVFVARQLVKHQVGLVWNEVSRRYVDSKPEFYVPFIWRGAPENAKQGSSEKELEFDISYLMEKAEGMYNQMIDEGIAPEMARMILPQNMMTEWYWTGSLMAFARVCNLRNKPDSQEETRMITQQMAQHLRDHFPISARELLDEKI
jgi:thymidylate synthase (FAD)|tara:strand:+ start:409 stop:1029 length:621 start_codon:yes stop_codon:yes gene_type:complete